MNKILKNIKKIISEAKGFSLVELIVAIAIMVVMAAVLAPSLLAYVEKSRLQKDDSTIDEITETIKKVIIEPDAYDEIIELSISDNYSCYVDSEDASAEKIYTTSDKSPSGSYIYKDDLRKLDEITYTPAGRMRGVTITFTPQNNKIDLNIGVVNKFKDMYKSKILSECPNLYNSLRQTVGDKISLSSQTYRNSEYTVFINITNNNKDSKYIDVYGQWSGTNIAKNTYKPESFNEYGYRESLIREFTIEEKLLNSWKYVKKTYKYVAGMTWKEWIESPYNTGNYRTFNTKYGNRSYITNGNHRRIQICWTTEEKFVYDSDGNITYSSNYQTNKYPSVNDIMNFEYKSTKISEPYINCYICCDTSTEYEYVDYCWYWD